MSGARHRQKGDRVERELVAAHLLMGVHAERVPLSGASRYQDNGGDLDIYPFGREAGPLCCEVKARRNGAGFKTLARWLDDNDVLFLREDRAEPLVVLPWHIWRKLLTERA